MSDDEFRRATPLWVTLTAAVLVVSLVAFSVLAIFA